MRGVRLSEILAFHERWIEGGVGQDTILYYFGLKNESAYSMWKLLKSLSYKNTFKNIKKLEKNKLIEFSHRDEYGKAPIFYKITDRGKKRLQLLKQFGEMLS